MIKYELVKYISLIKSHFSSNFTMANVLNWKMELQGYNDKLRSSKWKIKWP